MKSVFLYNLMILLVVTGVHGQGWDTRMDTAPATFLWVWEYPQDMRFVGGTAGIAYLARTVYVKGDQVVVRPRMQKLLVDPKTRMMAVVRIETERPALSEGQREKVVEAILEAAKAKQLEGVQIDFDAKVSERPFYRLVLQEVRRKLPDWEGLSITALASWCMGDNWVKDLPVDEIVPMLFRMGAEKDLVRRDWVGDSVCRGSLGLSTDEPEVGRPAAKVYWFHPGPWDRTAAEKAINHKWTP